MNEITKRRKVLLRSVYMLTIFGAGKFGLMVLFQGKSNVALMDGEVPTITTKLIRGTRGNFSLWVVG